MRISDYIFYLEEIMREHGDLEVQTYNAGFDRTAAIKPRLDYEAALEGRESKPRFLSNYQGWCPQEEIDRRRGKKVCRV